MNKIILAFALLIVIFIHGAVVEAARKPCRRQCSSRIPSEIVCAQDREGSNCRMLKACELRELNCRLRSRNQAMLMQTYMQRCRFITGKTGRNKCAPPLLMIRRKPRTLMRDCKHLRCMDNSKRACYRCPYKGGICQLLTACQAERENCQRRGKCQLIHVDDYECENLKLRQTGRCKKFN